MMAFAALDGSDLREVAAVMSGERAGYEPNEQRADFYSRIYNDVYKELYPRLSALFPTLAEHQR
jgi:sugar (pentulose or hexulose) kinase